MPTIITKRSYLELNSIPLATPGYWITNLTTGMYGRTLKGGDTDVPHARGGLPNKRHNAITRKQFQLIITGSYKNDGTFNSDWQAGFEANVDYLEANIGIAVTGNGTVPSIWHRFSATNKSADVIVSAWEVGELEKTKRHGLAVLELTVPLAFFS